MEGRLKEKKALITAAGAGIGRATAEAFEREGCHVVATDLDAGKLEGLAGELLPLDVRSTDAVRALAARIGPIRHPLRLRRIRASWNRVGMLRGRR